jgi:predicted nucleic acid-binding Zn finger protein
MLVSILKSFVYFQTLDTETNSKRAESRSSNREDKARRVVESLAVKLHKFQPSGIVIWTVVGSDRDFLVDFGNDNPKPYCSCNDFHFRVLSGRVPECYHLLAARTAAENEMYSVVEFSDDEFAGFMRALVSDNFSNG